MTTRRNAKKAIPSVEEVKEVKKEIQEVKKEAKKEVKELETKNNELLHLLLQTLAEKEKSNVQKWLNIINAICWIVNYIMMLILFWASNNK